jgi:hypothetical protein
MGNGRGLEMTLELDEEWKSARDDFRTRWEMEEC